MEYIDLQISREQKAKLQKLCVESGEPEDHYILMAQILLNQVIDQ